MRKAWTKRQVIILIILAGVFLAACGKEDRRLEDETDHYVADGIEFSDYSEYEEYMNKKNGQYLPEFQHDSKTYKWFYQNDGNPPVSMKYSEGSIAPWECEITDSGLIEDTIAALQTVNIGSISDYDSNSITDAGSNGFYFTMEDGSEQSFYFEISYMRW